MQLIHSKLQKLVIFEFFLLFDYLWPKQRVWYLLRNGFIYDLAQILFKIFANIIV
jgi:hypothetical protein